ncbi:MAG: Mur ligase family protein, partial [Alphaproteobacteria bacterium]|nr:Mur ligase family protein [Alphaproteobacteria bacterium]
MNTPPPPLWTHDEVTAATGSRTAGEKAAPWTADGVSIDSRTLEKNDLFIAIAGPNFDGHDFVGKAFAADAAAAMVSHLPESLEDSRPLLLVDDTRQGLENLAAAARARTAARITAITGSVGKTSTKEALRLALEPQGATTASIGNLNNQWGVPLSLARMPGESVFGVFELGMNHPGEIVPLSKMVRPHVAIITSIEPVHSEFFASIAHIAEAKAEIFQGMDEGAAVLPRENPFFPVLAETAREHGVTRIIGFGAHPEADARLVECDLQPLTSHI